VNTSKKINLAPDLLADIGLTFGLPVNLVLDRLSLNTSAIAFHPKVA
jgi:hypothetical protein